MVNFQAITTEQIKTEKNYFQNYANSITEDKYQELIEKAQNGCEQSNSILEDIDIF